MARPKLDHAEQFTSGEISHGAGISVRNLQVIRDNGLAPEGNQWLPESTYDVDGMMRFALIGGFASSGLPLLSSARMVRELRYEFNDFEFGSMSRLAANNRGKGLEIPAPNRSNHDVYFWMHHAMRTIGSANYRVGEAWSDDKVLWIADDRYALIDVHERKHAVRMAFGAHTVEPGPDPFCQIIREPGTKEPTILPIHRRAEWNDENRQLELLAEYRSALRNALAAVRINMSATVRRCADRIHDLRVEKGGAIFEL